MSRPAAAGALAALVFVAGCGKTHQTTTVRTTERVSFSVYFLRDGKVAAARRSEPAAVSTAETALDALERGPTSEERAAGLASAESNEKPFKLAIADGVADVSGDALPSPAQVVYTLTQFPSVKTVRINGGRKLTRADFERVTPSIFVESPTVGGRVKSPLHMWGTANTFEANFDYELRDASGRLVAHNFVTATSGSGTRGTFDVRVPFHVDRPGRGSLTVYEPSAADGSHLHVVRIPLELR